MRSLLSIQKTTLSPCLMPLSLQLNNTFAQLPAPFYTKMSPERVTTTPSLLHVNPQAVALIGLPETDLRDPDFAAVFSGNLLLNGSEPLAQVYSGHQFGVWAGQLGDGRALLLGDANGWELQLKGAGQTPYSRMGDGRAVMRSSIREYLCSEAMAGLGIPTTRALCIVATNEPVQRETLEPGAIITRLSPSHIRFGHFEHFYHHAPQYQDDEHTLLRTLADTVIASHFPDITPQDDGQHYIDWFQVVVESTASLMADWQAVGFAHGVMNTDNMSILGLTIDYGPFGFLERYDPGFICNHSDHHGRYAFGQQPNIGFWNLRALATALQPLIPLEALQEALADYGPLFQRHFSARMRGKLGLKAKTPEANSHWQGLLSLMLSHTADYTSVFRGLSSVIESPEAREAWLIHFVHDAAASTWLDTYLAALAQQGDVNVTLAALKHVNPKYVLRNWVAETAIRAVEDDNDARILDDMLTLCHDPFSEHPSLAHFADPAPEAMRHLCVSCSS